MKIPFVSAMFSCLSLTLLLLSCKERECEEPPFANLATVQLTFKDRYGMNLYSDFGGKSQYNKDSLRVRGTAGNIYNNRGSATDSVGGVYYKYYRFSFGDVYQPDKDADALVKKICKDYYVYYNALDTDTLQVCYQVEQLRCGSQLAPFEVYRRGQLVARTERGVFFASNNYQMNLFNPFTSMKTPSTYGVSILFSVFLLTVRGQDVRFNAFLPAAAVCSTPDRHILPENQHREGNLHAHHCHSPVGLRQERSYQN